MSEFHRDRSIVCASRVKNLEGGRRPVMTPSSGRAGSVIDEYEPKPRRGRSFPRQRLCKARLSRWCSQSPWSLNNACDIRAAGRNIRERERSIATCARFGESAGGTARLLV